jgi:hypothetical protein
MGGPCFAGGGTLEECLFQGEQEAIIRRADCIASRADYQVYDAVDLGDGTAVFYEISKEHGMGRASRAALKDGRELNNAEVIIAFKESNQSITYRLNNNLMRLR